MVSPLGLDAESTWPRAKRKWNSVFMMNHSTTYDLRLLAAYGDLSTVISVRKNYVAMTLLFSTLWLRLEKHYARPVQQSRSEY